MTEAPVRRCPECRCKVRRLLGTGAGVIFKGSGFYATDYRSDSYQASEKKESRESTPDSGKKEAKPDKKSAKKESD